MVAQTVAFCQAFLIPMLVGKSLTMDNVCADHVCRPRMARSASARCAPSDPERRHQRRCLKCACLPVLPSSCEPGPRGVRSHTHTSTKLRMVCVCVCFPLFCPPRGQRPSDTAPDPTASERCTSARAQAPRRASRGGAEEPLRPLSGCGHHYLRRLPRWFSRWAMKCRKHGARVPKDRAATTTARRAKRGRTSEGMRHAVAAHEAASEAIHFRGPTHAPTSRPSFRVQPQKRQGNIEQEVGEGPAKPQGNQLDLLRNRGFAK